jgi:hypothetical protein
VTLFARSPLIFREPVINLIDIRIQLWPLYGFVAQIGLRLSFPFSRMDLAYGDGTWYAKSCEAVLDRSSDLDLRNLPIEVPR